MSTIATTATVTSSAGHDAKQPSSLAMMTPLIAANATSSAIASTPSRDNKQRRRRVLFIGIDGVRADCISSSLTPNIWALKSDKTLSSNARTSFLTISAPGWTSALTGQWPNKTKAFDNDFREYSPLIYPTIMHRIAQCGLQSHVVSSWDAITNHVARGYCYTDDDDRVTDHVVHLLNGSLSLSPPSSSASSLLASQSSSDDAIPSFTSSDPDFIFVHLGSPDLRGHEHGFTSESKQYMHAIGVADGHVGRILDSLTSSPTYDTDDDWLVIITTDHGGGGQFHDDHGDDTPCVRNIFLFAARQQVSPSASSSPSSSSSARRLLLSPLDVPATSEIVDCAVVSLHHLQWSQLKDAMVNNGLDGRLFTDITPHMDQPIYRIWWDQHGDPLESPPSVLPP